MAKQSMAELTAKVAQIDTIKESAEQLVRGLQERLDAAVKVAESNGATKAQLDPLFVFSASLHTEATELSAAILTNTSEDPGP